MATRERFKAARIVAKRLESAISLDTLEQLAPKSSNPPGQTSESRELLRKRAKAKHFTFNLASKLAEIPDSPLRYSYLTSLHCASVLTRTGDKVTGEYCGHRWCMVCNRIRVARSINGYSSELAKLVNSQFVTLTDVTVPDHELYARLRRMIHVWQLIQKRLRKMKIFLRGIRKLECTYNFQTDRYHPHFHLIIEGKVNAELIKQMWLEYHPTADPYPQNITPCDSGSMKELFKYFTKVISYDKSAKTRRGSVHISSLDIIFVAMRGLRVFQPFGIKKNVSEGKIENLEAVEMDRVILADLDAAVVLEGISDDTRKAAISLLLDESFCWRQGAGDWFALEYEFALSGHVPAEWVAELFRNVHYDPGK